ncbi:MAG TPA: DHA2 family efflux MFS transporter permease subunit [Candidatus Acidoferrum sp.]|nr:DHA2 family efflux MFS transporter permease subunit [Candidatus Acidoferrum sp.]
MPSDDSSNNNPPAPPAAPSVAASQQNPAHINPWIIAIAVMLSTFMEVLDTTVVNVSLPHIAGSLSATVDEATWTLTSYLVANAIILPLTGWLSNYFGRKRMLMMSVTGFTIASFMCGLAPSLPFLIVCRVIQGACGGGLQPISQAVLLESFPPQDRGKAMGFWGLGIVVAPLLGPVLGGWLTDSYSWRWVFYINVPIGLASIVMTRLYVFDPAYIKRATSRIDYWGIGMLAVGIGFLQIVLDKGQEKDWFATTWITVVAVAAVVALVAFMAHELMIDHPVVQLRVFKDRTYSTGVFLMSMLGVGLYGTTVLIPLILQTLLGYPALRAGIAMAPRGLGSFIAMPIVGLIMMKFDPRKMLALGLFVCALTLFQFSALNRSAGYWDFFWPQLEMGLSLGLVFVPLTTITMSNIPKETMGNATSLFNLVRNLGGSIGISAVSAMELRLQQTNTNVLGAHVNPLSASARNMMNMMEHAMASRSGDAVAAAHQARAMVFGLVQREAAMISYNTIFKSLGILFIALLPFILLMRRPSPKAPAVAAH